MKIKFDFEIDDWMEFQKFYIQNSIQHKRARFISTLIVPGFFVVFLTSYFKNGGTGIFTPIILGLISLAWILFYPKRMFNRTMDKAREMLENGDNSGIIGTHELFFSNDGLIHIEPESEQKFKWSGIKKLEETSDFYFLYNTAISAIIIPKRKIESDIEELSKILKTNIA